ncbi:MAG: lipid-A-disaccharide synthase [Candidatus Aminicenantes bacterium]|nr:lipid-A-disaccharide synthase [Candidatus Aminicenantes bacterium]
MNSVLIVAGEKSGENYGAAVVREFLKLEPGTAFFGVGGRNMADAGVEILAPMEDLAVVGLAEVVTEIPRIGRLLRRLAEDAGRRNPAAALLIDSPDFNLRLAKRLKALGVPVLYYIGPTVWAWRRGRLKTVRDFVRKMCFIFPFEESLYREAGIPARFVGHPLLGRVRVRFGREEFLAKYGLDPGRPLIALMPGSRRSEVRSHMPTLVRAARRLREEVSAQFVLLQAEDLDPDLIPSFLSREEVDVLLLRQDAYEALAASDIVLSACGTANLEAALLGAPLVSFYRLSPLTYALGRPFVRIGRYSIVNILAGRPVVPEFIQRRFEAEGLAAEALRLLADGERRTAMRAEFLKIRESLGEENAAGNVARELRALVRPSAAGG